MLAILLEEPTAARLVSALATTDARHLSTASLLEAEIAAARRGGDALARHIDVLLDVLHVDGAAITVDQVAIARGEPLLFVGDDFARTDVPVATY